MGDVLVQFYRDRHRCSLGYLRDLHGWQGQYDKLETNHLYIQWLFPNYFQSQFNTTAPQLSKPEAHVFRNDGEIARKYIQSYRLFLDFLGLRLIDSETGEIGRAPNGRGRLYEALVLRHHNHLRIRRVLASLAITGFERYMSPLVNHLRWEILGISLRSRENGFSVRRRMTTFLRLVLPGRDKPALRPLRNIPSALETWEKYVDGNSANHFKNTRASEEDRAESVFFGRDVTTQAPAEQVDAGSSSRQPRLKHEGGKSIFSRRMARTVIFAQDDHAAAECLVPLSSGHRVLGVGNGASTSIFARRCVELGFGFASALEPEVVAGALERFKPDVTVLVPDLSGQNPESFCAGGGRQYVMKVGSPMKGAPWPEFAPIWLQQANSRVAICKASGEEVGAELVAVGKDETALSLRAKHALAGARLLKVLLEDGEGAMPKLELVSSASKQAPLQIDLSWDEDSVDRFIRAYLFPPHDPAVVEVPAKKETYFIENMEQFNDFRMKVLEEGTRDGNFTNRSYAADTHWYSNVGGSIVKMGDSDIHMPLKTSEKKHKAIIPGAAIGARKKLRMNEPLIGPNAERYCSGALASGWIGLGPEWSQAGKHRSSNFDVAVKAMSTALPTETGALPVASGICNESTAFDHLLEGPPHPNVVELVGRFEGLGSEDEQVHYFVTELLAGGSLEDCLQADGMEEATARSIIRSVCQGLASLHDQGVVHRDLKPGNVLFSKGEEDPKLIDFSHAALVSGDEETLTGELGTRGYVAPEVLSERPYGKKCDVFSLGCTVHALLSGRPPRRHLRVGFVQQLPSSVSPSARRFVEALLTVDPRSRPSAREALAERWLQEE
ncbi:CaMKI [Symbiodinium sp. CCMP2456]|nr:CaMKI [Symbiodinium sp. CCMP2456]